MNDDGEQFGQTIRPKRPPYAVDIAAQPDCLGTMTLTSDNRLRSSTGALRPR